MARTAMIEEHAGLRIKDLFTEMEQNNSLDPEQLARIVNMSKYIHEHTDRGRPDWMFKSRQLGFEKYQRGMLDRYAYELMLGQNKEKDIFKLAMKVIRGDEFTAEDLQLQANEPEALEKVLNDIKKFMEK